MKIFIKGSSGLLGQKLITNIQKITPAAQVLKLLLKESPITGFVLDKPVNEFEYDSVSFEEGLALAKS